MKYKWAFILLLILNILDVITTVTFLELNIASEGNPLVAKLLEESGYLGAFSIKAIFLGYLAWLLYKLPENHAKWIPVTMLSLANILYIGVVIINSMVIMQHFEVV